MRLPHESITLADGRDYQVRPLNSGDVRRLQAFFYSHTDETISFRYGAPLNEMTRGRALELVGVDQESDVALALVAQDGPLETIHAVARYYRDPDRESAEFAVVVDERRRRLGIARLLLQRLQGIAAAQGLSHLWAQVDVANQPIRRLLRSLGGLEDTPEEGTVYVRIPVAD